MISTFRAFATSVRELKRNPFPIIAVLLHKFFVSLVASAGDKKTNSKLFTFWLLSQFEKKMFLKVN